MAVIGKIRSWGPVLIIVIGFALFAFIAEELFRSWQSTRNDSHQQIGVVLGEKISAQDFQKLMDEYQEVYKMQGQQNLNEEQMNQLKDQVWQSYVSNKVLESEAKKLGLTVTDAEMQNVLTQGTNPMLLSTPFVNQQTQRFDVNELKKFLSQYEKSKNDPQMGAQLQTIYKYWNFIEKTLRQNLLAQKYQTLLAGCLLSNPVEAAAYAQEAATESDIQLASFLYADVKDDAVKVTDEELKAKYNELKPLFKWDAETRDAKYIAVKVSASSTDRAALQKEFEGYRSELAATEDASQVVRKSTSLVSYLGMPQTKAAFPSDIAQQIDSLGVGETSKVFESKGDNTLNVVKLISKTNAPDSVQYCQIQVGAETAEKAHTLADSILTALKGGADFAALAKKYNQTGDSVWISTNQYQHSPSLDQDTRKYITALYEGATGEYQNIEVGQGNIIVKVLEKRGNVDKYVAAVVKKTIDYSKDTRNTAYNNFSTFMSANQTLESITKNAQKAGYTVLDAENVTTTGHTFANIRSTRDALKWLFEAKEGDVSQMFECGNNGDQLLYIALDKINKKGYLPLENARVNEFVKNQVIKDKKAALLMDKAAKVKTVADAVKAGAKNDTISQVTFNSPVAVKAGREQALAGAVAATAQGKFVKKPVKGENGVYVFTVTKKAVVAEKKQKPEDAEKTTRQRAMQFVGGFMQELIQNADITDNRYLFF